MTKTPKRILTVSKIILTNPQKELLLYLRDNKQGLVHSGYWDFIGGGLEPKENPLEALIREINEEIPNCEVTNIEYIGKIYFKEKNVELIMFKGKINSLINKIQDNLKEGQDARYFKINDLDKIKIYKGYKDFVFRDQENIF